MTPYRSTPHAQRLVPRRTPWWRLACARVTGRLERLRMRRRMSNMIATLLGRGWRAEPRQDTGEQRLVAPPQEPMRALEAILRAHGFSPRVPWTRYADAMTVQWSGL